MERIDRSIDSLKEREKPLEGLMFGDSVVFGAGSSADAAAPAALGSHESGQESSAPDAAAGQGSNSGEEERGGRSGGDERSVGGNRWPRQETLSLLKIRSDMNAAFRDAGVKGPLWEEVSRKLAEHGYNRSAKKCKEKFENVYKYHKRTKDGRTGKGDCKTYRFFDQLEALDSNPFMHSVLPEKSQTATPPFTMAMAMTSQQANPTVPSTTATTSHGVANPNLSFSPSLPIQANPTTVSASLFGRIPTDHLLSHSTSSSSTSSEIQGRQRSRRKRKWKELFERVMKEVIDKQEDMQKRFMEAMEKREHDRMVREEAWRMQEMTRINREREILAQERSMAASKDAVVMSFLKKIADQNNISHLHFPPPPQPPPPPHPPQPQVMTLTTSNPEQNFSAASSSRWPKVEVQALIQLRTSLDSKYQDSGAKGPLWDEISAAMRKLGYNRNAKRCKEKWENINKYFKKVKESNKNRPENSKTCPYFHILDAIYKDKNPSGKPESLMGTVGSPFMVTPEQQWPTHQETPPVPDSTMKAMESDQQHYDDDEDDKDGDEEDEGGSNFEIVPSKPSS